MTTDYITQLKNSLSKPNNYIDSLRNFMQTGVLPLQEKQPETNPLEQEIQGLKEKNYSFEDVNFAIDNDNTIQDKTIARELASKVYKR